MSVFEAARVDVEKLVLLPDNPKTHDHEFLEARMEDRGYAHRIIVNPVNMHVLHGNGRTENIWIRKRNGKDPYEGIEVEDGKWMIDIDYLHGVPDDPTVELAIAIEFNKAQDRGAYDDAKLEAAIAAMPIEEAKKTGLDPETVEAIHAYYAIEEDDPEEWEEIVSESESSLPQAARTAKTESNGDDTPAQKTDRLEDLSILRYIVRSDVLKTFRRALRTAMKADYIHDEDQAIELIAQEFLNVYDPEANTDSEAK